MKKVVKLCKSGTDEIISNVIVLFPRVRALFDPLMINCDACAARLCNQSVHFVNLTCLESSRKLYVILSNLSIWRLVSLTREIKMQTCWQLMRRISRGDEFLQIWTMISCTSKNDQRPQCDKEDENSCLVPNTITIWKRESDREQGTLMWVNRVEM